jgi:hypothetical protein
MPHHQHKYRVTRRMEAQRISLVVLQVGKASVRQELIAFELVLFMKFIDSLVVFSSVHSYRSIIRIIY